MNSHRCEMLRDFRVAIVYIYPRNGAGEYMGKAGQFLESYVNHPPGIAHDTVIVSNGAAVSDHTTALFGDMPGCSFIEHDNSGWDIGGFQKAAATVPCDLMVFFGAHSYFRGPNWLARMVEIWQQHGDTLYGCTGNQGNVACGVWPHIRTTAFWCSPKLMNAYPHKISSEGSGGQRYEMEHGKNCMTNWIKSIGKHPWIVGWNTVAHVDNCDSIPGTYHQGSQHNVMVGDRLTCAPYHPTP